MKGENRMKVIQKIESYPNHMSIEELKERMNAWLNDGWRIHTLHSAASSHLVIYEKEEVECSTNVPNDDVKKKSEWIYETGFIDPKAKTTDFRTNVISTHEEQSAFQAYKEDGRNYFWRWKRAGKYTRIYQMWDDENECWIDKN